MITEVWRLKGLTGSTPGLLHHESGQVRLELLDDDDRLREAGKAWRALLADR